ncbi:hypothetical protein DCO58_11935 [Helicobacter saguini]|uniref:VirB3 type IV secretion protein n=1 Tax=Helicobacter saguini TaxID=1548018 RepID=A0A099BCA1_9HELI|nr:hypothetical protein [Helicobacter saguini]MWV61001.1 hypothetical protein [Helicobacter saguini]MWV61758.1 hypothetical protein [Helicobacter saguini]MWV67569.1 hypothetical protein [Helicobacter saguini]MWV68330.1 hypothetical protein [Helicobacter saguini]MWV69920.1 hypothetical protein [Helicobacter saguini]
MISVNNIREITKKDKIKGLSRNAWMLILCFGVTAFIFFFLWGLLMTLILMIVLAILEYFDDDIYDIVYINLSNSFKKFYYA